MKRHRLIGLLVLLVGIVGLYGTYRGWSRQRASASELWGAFGFCIALICTALPASVGLHAIEALVQRKGWVRAVYVIASLALALACAALAWGRWGWNFAALGWLAASALFVAGGVVILLLDYRSALHGSIGHGNAGRPPSTPPATLEN
ncbi:MAG TPA: hypothetical protein VE084_21430 [Burkholderiaceae bacterium]|nr:hypothetical protein [Burkholderiaceae bacterium]